MKNVSKEKTILTIKYDKVLLYQVNNSVIFSGKSVGFEEFLSRMVEALGIIIDRHPKGRLRKNGS